ncbi:hypothetical protein TorRG33x02_043190 [Trema orientale]|uniref:Uncharacterized protein n=1 Tax=Trema orientale TaxID=63057 RepID=A0A2P5FQ19_TREOI|nr:hypothetical protein TorRG33x02_043190 [Trema orientale]
MCVERLTELAVALGFDGLLRLGRSPSYTRDTKALVKCLRRLTKALLRHLEILEILRRLKSALVSRTYHGTWIQGAFIGAMVGLSRRF